MPEPHSDALVLFGATGDLAYEQIFPALEAMTRCGHLDVPIIGVAKPDWTVDQLRAGARESLAPPMGDRTLFGSEADVEAAWCIVDPILKGGEPPCEYDRGSWGPAEAGRIAPQPGGWIEPGEDEPR